MNLILLTEQDFISQNSVQLKDRRFKHIVNIIQANVGDQLKVGLINGNTGQGVIRELRENVMILEVNLDTEPPEPLPITLLLALPRPIVLKRILQTVTSFGIKKIYLVNTHRVEKSFWQSSLLKESKEIEKMLLLGLEQAGDTVLPEVILKKRFKSFLEDDLPAITKGSEAYVAHVGSPVLQESASNKKITLFIGPEGGFISYEIEQLIKCGFQPVCLAERILKVETAVTAAIAKFS